MSKKKSLEDNFLQRLQDENIEVSIFLVSGIKLHGRIEEFDDDVVLLKNDSTQLIFKHAISTVVLAAGSAG